MADRALFIASCVGDTVSGDRSVLVPWWSITKTCLPACALILVAGGRLDLDRFMLGRRFTLRQLLQHTSGLNCYTEHPDYDPALDHHDDPWSDEILLAQVDSVPPLFKPGQGWTYSNTGYFLVRRLIEQTTGADIEHALNSLVLAPLGIEKAFIARQRADLQRSVWGDEDNFHPGWVAHGLLMGSPAEAAAFMHGLFTGTLLPVPLRDAMRLRHPVHVNLPDRPWRTAGYGLGLMMDSVAAAYHFPDLDPPRTVAAFAPTDDQGIAERAVLEEAARLR
ncbi:MAG: class A beta-lactamase-related serine hydrolase [Xanthobacteraceae bacterium]|nr:class A beta-lactamase-related serine hydrolase [Xanthobacteraceae bacterium]